ncbi:MAG: hypothetical protein HY317_05780 [Acidobacteria bacterium]|nr:hypothetical protein [Acidobacteriota bacterium]
MAVHILWNTLRDPVKNENARTAILDVLGKRPEQEHWDVKLTESPAIPGWVAVIQCPNHKKVAWHFHGYLEEDSPDAVRQRIDELLRAVGF